MWTIFYPSLLKIWNPIQSLSTPLDAFISLHYSAQNFQLITYHNNYPLHNLLLVWDLRFDTKFDFYRFTNHSLNASPRWCSINFRCLLIKIYFSFGRLSPKYRPLPFALSFELTWKKNSLPLVDCFSFLSTTNKTVCNKQETPKRNSK